MKHQIKVHHFGPNIANNLISFIKDIAVLMSHSLSEYVRPVVVVGTSILEMLHPAQIFSPGPE